MKGTTHLAIGTGIGAFASAYYPFSVTHTVYYVSVAVISALIADLDGPSLLSRKLGKLSKWLRELVVWIGMLSTGSVIYLYVRHGIVYPELSMVALVVLLLAFVAKAGVIRNILVSIVGFGMMYAGWMLEMSWLLGFGGFVAWIPWLKHRGLSHTVWAMIIWGAIAWGLENQLQVEGITIVALAGYFSHLLADTLTPSGVKWLFPLSRKSVKLPF